jgi:LmbE family N-acetylglucosaminyl deacetylase
MLARLLRRIYRLRICKYLTVFEPSHLSNSALVFAPHPDDETLGCGGAIIRKTRAQADVGVIFLANGSASHQHLMDMTQLVALREKEALAACNQLGVNENKVQFLAYPDGSLYEHMEKAVERVAGLIEQHKPVEVYVPFANDNHPDHQATHHIVMEALDCIYRPAMVYEYPVWYWYHWPWISLNKKSGREMKTILKNTLKARFGLNLQTMNYAFDILEVLPEKRAALEEHKSQMVNISPDSKWATLENFSNGEFLACFFHHEEVFARYLRQPSGAPVIEMVRTPKRIDKQENFRA